MAERNLAQQATTRLRRIEGQVRGIQRMLDRLDEPPEALAGQVRALLAEGKSQAQVARTVGVSRQRVADIARGRESVDGERCHELLTQILAVRAAVEQVGLLIMELHLECCVLDGTAIDQRRMKELQDSIRRWSRLGSA